MKTAKYCFFLVAFGVMAGCVRTDVCVENPSDPRCLAEFDMGRDMTVTTDARTDTSDASTVDAGPCNGLCSGATPYCRTSPGAPGCVACLIDDHCQSRSDAGTDAATDSGAQDASSDSATDAALADAGPAPLPRAYCSPSRFECVECTSNAHCRDPNRSVCSNGTCTGCNTDSDCTHLRGVPPTIGTPVCDVAAHRCVQCTVANRTACGASVCDVRNKTCATGRMPNTRTQCEPCVSTEECLGGTLMTGSSDAGVDSGPRDAAADAATDAASADATTSDAGTAPQPQRVCAIQRFGGREIGSFCMWTLNATSGSGAPAGACSRARPYVDPQTLNSVEGQTFDGCGLGRTTCPALNDFFAQSCTMPDTMTGDAQCGAPAVNDGLCRMLDMAANRCTVPCGSNDDCKPGFDCNLSLGECRFTSSMMPDGGM